MLEALLVAASPPDTLILPTSGREIPRPWFLPSAQAFKDQQRILASRYFLVRNSGVLGERLICGKRLPNGRVINGCGAKHAYLTLRCVEQPFSGLTQGLYAYYRAVGDNGLIGELSPSERVRFDGISELLGSVPDFATRHPETVRGMGIAPTDLQMGMYAMGVVEPIPPSLARQYADRINARGVRPRFTLPGLAGPGGS